MLANYLCDSTLEKSDFEIKSKCGLEYTLLPDRIFHHPRKTAEQLRLHHQFIPTEVVLIVEQHHERPDGKGYPSGLTANRFNQLAAIFILCHEYIDRLAASDFDHSKNSEITKELRMIYAGGPFDKAMDALYDVVK